MFPLLGVLWSPVLVLLHEMGHAFAAMGMTDGEVSITMRRGGLFGGTATYEPSALRRSHGEAWIAAAGPVVTLVIAVALWQAWLKSGSDSLATVLGAGALVATLQFLTCALPLRYGAGLGGPAESDGMVVWRVLTGAPPGGIERELRRLGTRERAARPVYVVVLAVAFGLALAVDPWLAIGLIGLFGMAALLQHSEGRR